MYDTIVCKEKLPVNQDMVQLGLDKTENMLFQTRNFNGCFLKYILQDTTLFEVKYKNQRFVEDKKHFAGGYLANDGEYLVNYPHHGRINMYDFKEVGNWDCWIEYNITFSKGKMVDASLVKFDKTDNTERKKELNKFYEDLNRINNIYYNKYFLNTKLIKWFRKKLRDLLWYVADTLLSISVKL